MAKYDDADFALPLSDLMQDCDANSGQASQVGLTELDLTGTPEDPGRLKRGILLESVLTPEECGFFMRSATEVGMQTVQQSGYNVKYRNNDRVVGESKEVAMKIWDRVKVHFSPIIIEEDPNDSTNLWMKGTWMPIGLNEVFRICRYQPGGHFSAHCDGVFQRNEQERSFYTFMLYLNESGKDFEAGCTRFLKDESHAERKMCDDGKCRFITPDKDVLFKLPPKEGSCLAFTNQLLHDGEQVQGGEKWIMRSEVMYKRVETEGRELTPSQKAAWDLLKEAEDHEVNRRPMEACECYRRAYKLWPEIENGVCV